MGNVDFNLAVAIGVQSAFGTINGTIRDLDLTAGLDNTDGLVLGARDEGDGKSGITIPSRVPSVVELAAAGRTQVAPSYLLTAIEGLVIAYVLKGNGDDSGAPDAGAAIPGTTADVGLDALNQMAGFVGANGAAPTYDYTIDSASNFVYGTIKLWIGNTGYVYQDCLISTRETQFTAGKEVIRRDTVGVGKLVPASTATGITWPTGGSAPDYGNQASLQSPIVEGVANIWGVTRGFNELTITVENAVADFGDSNIDDTGILKLPGIVAITATGTLIRNDSDDDFEYEQSIYGEAASTFNFQVGTVSGVSDTLNAFKITMPTPRVDDIKEAPLNDVRLGDTFTLTMRGATEGSEYTETYN